MKVIRILSSLVALVAVVLPTTVARAADDTVDKILDRRCAKCHGTTGKGDGSALKQTGADTKPMDWTNKAAMAKRSDADLVKIIELGGKGVNMSKEMPAYTGKLSDAEIAAVVKHIRSLGK